MDLPGLQNVLATIEAGGIEVYARDTVQPSVFCHQILNAMPYAFLDDAPLEERRARAVTLRRALPEDARELGRLDDSAIAEEHANAWPPIRDADELHDALLNLGILPETDAGGDRGNSDSRRMAGWFADLAAAGRAYCLNLPDGWRAWVAAERLPTAFAAYAPANFSPPPANIPGVAPEMTTELATLSIVRGWVRVLWARHRRRAWLQPCGWTPRVSATLWPNWREKGWFCAVVSGAGRSKRNFATAGFWLASTGAPWAVSVGRSSRFPRPP